MVAVDQIPSAGLQICSLGCLMVSKMNRRDGERAVLAATEVVGIERWCGGDAAVTNGSVAPGPMNKRDQI